jgi:hypothetical protein
MPNLWPGALVEIRTARGLRLARVIRANWPYRKPRALSDGNVFVRLFDDGRWQAPKAFSQARVAHVYAMQQGQNFERIGLPHVRPATRKSYSKRRAVVT